MEGQLRANDLIAARMRACFDGQGVLALSVSGTPGAGKTTLLEQTLRRLPEAVSGTVLVSDAAGDDDMARLSTLGHPIERASTEGTGRLDATMVARYVCPTCLPGNEGCAPFFDLLLIENAGNLVEQFDLGEDLRVLVLSTEDDEDVPLRLAGALKRSTLVVINKRDLLPEGTGGEHGLVTRIGEIHPDVPILMLSCLTGSGLDEWMSWLNERLASKMSRPTSGDA